MLAIAFRRSAPQVRDDSLPASAAVVVAYAYPYAQVAWLGWVPGRPVWPEGGFVLVAIAAGLSLASLLTLGRSFGIRPALRRLVNRGPYGVIRHPMYLSYLMSDVGYNLREWNTGSVLLVLAGWGAILYRLHAEERVLSGDPGWLAYTVSVPYRLFPALW